LHAFVIGHLAKRIADPESGRISRVGSISHHHSPRD
jgi:hypothetical protein